MIAATWSLQKDLQIAKRIGVGQRLTVEGSIGECSILSTIVGFRKNVKTRRLTTNGLAALQFVPGGLTIAITQFFLLPVRLWPYCGALVLRKECAE